MFYSVVFIIFHVFHCNSLIYTVLQCLRSSHELQLLGIKNQLLVINGILQQLNEADDVSRQLHNRQQKALQDMPAELSEYPMYSVPLRSYNLSEIGRASCRERV